MYSPQPSSLLPRSLSLYPEFQMFCAANCHRLTTSPASSRRPLSRSSHDSEQLTPTMCLPDLQTHLTGGDENVGGRAMSSEATLAPRQQSLLKVAVETTEEKESDDLPSDVEWWDASVVITGLPAPFTSAETGDGCVFGVHRDLSMSQHLPEWRRELVHQLVATIPVDFSWNRIRLWCFPAGELLHAANGFWKGWLEVQADADFHLGESVDGGARKCRGAVEDAFKVFGSALQNLPLLRQKRLPIGAENRCISLVRGSGVDHLDLNEEVLRFTAIDISLNHLDFACHSSVLYFLQPLLC
nr:unnamed protein product [Spirometra erinaceieuropaei]